MEAPSYNFKTKIQTPPSGERPKPKGVLCPSYFAAKQNRQSIVVDSRRPVHGQTSDVFDSRASCAVSSFSIDDEFYSFPPQEAGRNEDGRVRNGPGYQSDFSSGVCMSMDFKAVSIPLNRCLTSTREVNFWNKHSILGW